MSVERKANVMMNNNRLRHNKMTLSDERPRREKKVAVETCSVLCTGVLCIHTKKMPECCYKVMLFVEKSCLAFSTCISCVHEGFDQDDATDAVTLSLRLSSLAPSTRMITIYYLELHTIPTIDKS
jgi:hypothetical protein